MKTFLTFVMWFICMGVFLFSIVVGTLLCNVTLIWPGVLIGLLAGAIPIWRFVKLYEDWFYTFITGKKL